MKQSSISGSIPRRFGSRRGTAAVEVALMLPWIVFSFIGVLDFGFSAYALIATQNAARIAATYAATSSVTALAMSQANECPYAVPEFKYAPTAVTACGTTLSVSPTSSGVGSTGTGAGVLGTVKVAVTYTVGLIALPGLMPGSLAITRTVEMPIR